MAWNIPYLKSDLTTSLKAKAKTDICLSTYAYDFMSGK